MADGIWSSALAGLVALASAAAAPAQAQSLSAASATTATAPQPPPDLLGTIALPIRADRFGEEWRRAREDASRSPQMKQLIAPARALARDQQVEYVQAAVHQRIQWRSDATEWGRYDYWASAVQTLQHGVGDMEDRAIVKLQALRALGFAERDLYLTMGRDRVGGAITVLMVRLGGRFLMLDDTGGKPVAVDRRGFEFTPQLTLGWTSAWVHARRARAAAAPSSGAPGAAVALRLSE